MVPIYGVRDGHLHGLFGNGIGMRKIESGVGNFGFRQSVAQLLIILLMLASAAPLVAADWPQWRGPNRDGKASGFTAPEVWPKQLVQKWKVPVGVGDSTPALVRDRLYAFGRQGEDEVLQCL